MAQHTKRQAQDNADRRARGRMYNIVFALMVLLVVAIIGYQGLKASDTSVLALNGGETNAIPASGSANPALNSAASDTDIAGLRAAETGQLGEPALVWFHADW
ncbi:MAG: hypothetical protein HYR71_09335 [Chloroflexi bacterium]|nr:hypothetical protein [Chloroflexota bacterium]